MVLLLFVASLVAGGCRTAPEPTTESLRVEARAAAEAGDLERATGLVERALAMNPRHAASHALCGTLYALRGRTDLAIIGYERALSIDPTDAATFYNLGTLYLNDGEPLRAAQLLEQAARLRDDHAPTFNNLGKAYYMTGLPELAGPAFEEALALDPANESARTNLELLREGAS